MKPFMILASLSSANLQTFTVFNQSNECLFGNYVTRLTFRKKIKVFGCFIETGDLNEFFFIVKAPDSFHFDNNSFFSYSSGFLIILKIDFPELGDLFEWIHFTMWWIAAIIDVSGRGRGTILKRFLRTSEINHWGIFCSSGMRVKNITRRIERLEKASKWKKNDERFDPRGEFEFRWGVTFPVSLLQCIRTALIKSPGQFSLWVLYDDYYYFIHVIGGCVF